MSVYWLVLSSANYFLDSVKNRITWLYYSHKGKNSISLKLLALNNLYQQGWFIKSLGNKKYL